MFDDEDELFSMGDDSMMSQPLPTQPASYSNGGGAMADGLDLDMNMDMMGGGMGMGDDIDFDADSLDMALPPKPANPKAAKAAATNGSSSSGAPPIIDLIDDDDDDAYMGMNMPLPSLDNPPPRPAMAATKSGGGGGGGGAPAIPDLSSPLSGLGIPDPYAPLASLPAMEFPDLSAPTVDYRAQAQIDPAEAMRQMTQSMGLQGSGGMGGLDDLDGSDGAAPGMPQMARFSVPPGGMQPMGGAMPGMNMQRASMGPMQPMGGPMPGMGRAGGGGGMGGAMPFAPQMYQTTGVTGPASDSFKDRVKYGATVATENIEKTLEFLQLKKKDKAKHYVKAVLDKVRLDDPTLHEVNLSACRLNKGKLQSLVKSLRTNNQVKKLDFSNHGLAGGDASVIYLAKHLQDNKTITWIDIRMNTLTLKGIQSIEALLKINLNVTRVELFEPLYKGEQEVVAKTLTTIQWLLQGNFNYHAFLAGQSPLLILSGRSYKQLVARLLEGGEKCQVFDVSYNELEEIPDSIRVLSNAQEFLAQNNAIRTIPTTIGQLKLLKKLNLSFNQLSSLPDEFTKLELLEELNLSHNHLSELPEMFRLLTKLIHVDLSFNQLKRLPEELSNLEELETLLLSQNQLVELPDSIVLLSKVKKIDVSFNSLKKLPDERPNLLYLVDLLLSNNQLVYLPDGIGLLPELRRLDASNNKLVKLPNEITNLHRLEEMILNNNQLAELPEYIGLMWRLTKIDLMDNKLTAIPESIQLLKYLRTLDLQNNRLKRLHEFFATLVSLDELKIAGNENIKGIQQETIKLGDSEVIATVQQLPKIIDKSWRTKLMVVGAGACGKSSVVDRLHERLDKNFKPKKDDVPEPTAGIRILELIMGTNETKVGLGVWDFSGHDEFDLIQPLFLSPRGLYLVCFDMLEEAKADIKIEQTLQVVTSKAPDAPIILVGTHADDKKVNQKFRKVMFNRVKEKFYKRFPNIKTHLAVSGKTGKNIEALLERIQKYVVELEDIGENIPRGFLFLEDRVKVLRRVMKHPLANFDRFKDEILACGIDQTQTMQAMKHLHNAGLIIYFPRTFRDYVFIDAQWVADIFSSMPRMRKYVKKGFLPESELEQVWNPARHPPELHDLILSLLEGFELVLRPEGLQKIFVPAYLEEEPPPSPAKLNEMWPPGYEMEEPEFRRVYIFKFFPQGLFSRLIGRFVNNLGWELENYWKGGAIIVSPQYDRAFVKLDNIDKSLNIVVRGETAGDSLLHLLENTDGLVKSTMNLNVEVFVPCTHCLLLEEGKRPHLFQISEFEDAISEGKEYVLCRGEVAVKLRALLPNMGTVGE